MRNFGAAPANRRWRTLEALRFGRNGLSPSRSSRFGTSVLVARPAKNECGWRFAPQCCAWQSVRQRRRVQRRGLRAAWSPPEASPLPRRLVSGSEAKVAAILSPTSGYRVVVRPSSWSYAAVKVSLHLRTFRRLECNAPSFLASCKARCIQKRSLTQRSS